MAWQPQAGTVAQLSQFLRDSLSGHDINAQKNAEQVRRPLWCVCTRSDLFQMLRQAKGSPDMNNYLAYICVTPTPPEGLTQIAYHGARSAAAIMLKNNVKSSYRSIPEASRTYIKSTILAGLQDGNSQIRNFAGNVITEVVRQGGVMGWPQVFPKLISTLASEDGQSPPRRRTVLWVRSSRSAKTTGAPSTRTTLIKDARSQT